MSHRAALYMVEVRPKRKLDEYRPLGDIDKSGTPLIDVIATTMGGNFESTRGDGSRVLWCENIRIDSNSEILLSLQHGERGVAADVVDKRGQFRFRQALDDTQIIRCGCLLRLPREAKLGWMAIHNNSGRGVKALLVNGLDDGFRSRFDDLLLEITPFVSVSVLEEAVEENRIDHVRLLKYVQPKDPAFREAQKWIRSGDTAKVELDISSAIQNHRVRPGLIRGFLQGSKGLNDLVQFEGMTFDQAKVEVILPNGTRRTFNVEKLEAGHPLTIDLDEDLEIGEDGDPSQNSLLAALRASLDAVT